MRGAVAGQCPDRRHDSIQFRLVGPEPADLRRRARGQAGDQAFGRPWGHARQSLVGRHAAGGQDAVGQRQDLRRGAVVRLEADDPRRREPVDETDQVLAGRTGERVDRLVLVADDGQVVATTEPRVEERRLERVCVLELVDREPAIAVPDLGRDRRVRLDQPDRQLEHVLEVDPAGARLAGLVAAEQPGHQVGRERRVAVLRDREGLIVGRPDAARLRPLDLGGEVADREVAIAAGQAGGKRREDRHLRFEDGGRLGAVDAWPEMTKLAECRGMERGRRHASMTEVREPACHLACCLVRERDDQDVARADDLRGQRVGHPPRDHAGLAAAGPGQDAQRSVGDRDRLALGGIEVREEVVGVRGRHRAIVAGSPSPPVTRPSAAGLAGPASPKRACQTLAGR